MVFDIAYALAAAATRTVNRFVDADAEFNTNPEDTDNVLMLYPERFRDVSLPSQYVKSIFTITLKISPQGMTALVMAYANPSDSLSWRMEDRGPVTWEETAVINTLAYRSTKTLATIVDLPYGPPIMFFPSQLV